MLVEASKKIRLRVLDLITKKKLSHIGGAFSVVEILTYLYGSGKFNFQNKKLKNQTDPDLLFFSKGHACTALYATLEHFQYIHSSDLDTLSDNGSLFTTHVSSKINGIELSTGSLGHALSFASGIAYLKKQQKSKSRIVVILSDGELDEGSNWEAFLFIAHHNLNNLIIIIDYNKLQSFGFVHEVLSLEPITDKFKSFNFEAIAIDGHSFKDLENVIVNNQINKPLVIIANTIKGKGVSFMENKLEWHYKSPSSSEYDLAKNEIEGV